ncbi:NAD-dependent protein deacetylase [Haloferula helveola]|uniref:NAD-dependent protein deacetylase n=1 Tax=Haloferula helveola TaxID=490095 RepID=A0ABN6H371_9BACT|nr:NAD-dependent protein deacetylase [Haloferula helveola]
MTRTTYFLGAGASKAFGYPITSEILPKIVQRGKKVLARGTSGPVSASKKELKELLEKLFPALWRQPERDMPLITDLLTLLNNAIVTDTPVFIDDSEMSSHQRLRLRLEQGIVDALRPPYRRNSPPKLLRKFVDSLYPSDPGRTNESTVVSTNYDLSIEGLLYEATGSGASGSVDSHEVAARIDHGFTYRIPFASHSPLATRPLDSKVGLYKLHGSLNLLRCAVCKCSFLNPLGDVSWRPFLYPRSKLNRCDYCGITPLKPVIVAPSFVRDVSELGLSEVWNAAYEALRAAHRWVFVGYSLPPEDYAIRSLLLRAYRFRTTKPEVKVIQRKNTEEDKEDKEKQHLMQRYRLLFENPKFHFDGFEAFIKSPPGSKPGN